jgi:beta-galactosidase
VDGPQRPPDQPPIACPALERKAFDADPVNVAVDRPTSSSGSEPGHEAPMANDNHEQTWWQADARNGTAFWSLQLENVYALHWLSLVTPDDRGPGFVVESSQDEAHWQTLAEADGKRKHHEFALFEKPTVASYLRIRFSGATPEHPAMLSEVRVIAKPASEGPSP